ncbi:MULTISPECIES: DUF1292 domain-containing protein [Anaerococcus]|uniref:DUF1292 domain-containing protein n=1 Tax=Anaerococcus cruorum TaxID=3115617 RepID=A0ABW9MWX5_9FIRM
MTEKIELHGHELEFQKNNGKAVIEIDLGDATDECYLIDVFSVDGTDYVALISSESNEIYLFYYEDSFENDEVDLKVIEDEEELEEVFHLFTHYWDDEALDNLVEEYDNEIEHYGNEEEIIEDSESIDE